MLAFSVWNAIWVVVVAYLLLMVLMMMFSVVIDIFRDTSLSGWGKAGWLLFLAVFTLAALLVYVIVRGRGMNERQAQARLDGMGRYDPHPPEVAGANAAGELERAAALHEAGKLSDAEYAALKAKILA